MKGIKFLIAVLLCSVLFIGCGRNSSKITLPDIPGKSKITTNSQAGGGQICFGLWDFRLDRSTGEFEALPIRNGHGVLNVLGFLEPPAGEYLRVNASTMFLDPADGIADVTVAVTHPFTDTLLHGFDVRGTVFGPRDGNADGTTRWMNPSE